MADEDETIVVIHDDTQKPPETGQQTTGAAPDAGVQKVATQQPPAAAVPDDPVEDLKRQHERMQTRLAAERDQAIRDAAAARQEATAARTEIVGHQQDTVASGLEAAKAEAEAAEVEYRTALEAGEFAKAASVQRKISRAEAKIVRLEEAQTDLEQRAKAPAKPERPAQTAPTDPVDQFIASRSAPSAQWLRNHRDYVSDPKKFHKLNAAHSDAMGDGIEVDSPEYFSRVEQFLGMGEPAKANGGAAPATTTARRQSAPVAPVGHSAGGMNGGVEVRLSRSEATAATDGTHVWNYDDPSGQKRFKKGDVIGVQEFARRKSEMQKQGLYDRVYVEQ